MGACKFSQGNVIRDTDGDLWIVTDVTGGGSGKLYIEAIDFTHENCSASHPYEDTTRKEWKENDYGDDRYVEVKVKGWKHAKLEAKSVREFITKKFNKMMEL